MAGRRDKSVTSGAERAELTHEILAHVGEAIQNSALKGVKRLALREHTAGSQGHSTSAHGWWVKPTNPLHLRALPSARLALVREKWLQPPSQAPLPHS